MNVKEFLSQAYDIERKINSNCDKIRLLRELATKATSTFSDTPPNKNQISKRVEETVTEIVSIENSTKAEINELINAKLKIITVIGNIENLEYRKLLELRYLNFKKWNQIADEMSYRLRHLYKIHNDALKVCNSVLKKMTL